MEGVKGEVTPLMIQSFKTKFEANEKNLLALNVCSKHDPIELCTQRRVLESTNHVFTHKVDSEIKPMTNQKRSGNCWIFAALNALRIPFAKQHQVEDFEFSQNFILFWDKLERCNFYLNTVVELLINGEPIDSRLMSFLLNRPAPDGGQFDMVKNIVMKYGIVPKKCFPETFSTEATHRMNNILNSKLREYVRELHEFIKLKKSEVSYQEDIKPRIVHFMQELYRVISICLGIPPDTFTWEYYNKNKVYCCIGPVTPLKFYEDYVKPYYDVENKISLVNDPRAQNPFEEVYTVKCLNNMVGGRMVTYINLEINDLLKYTVESIKNNEAVWFGCDVAKRFANKLGIEDLTLHDYNLVFGTDVNTSISKAARLEYGDSAMSHAMVFTAVSLNDNGEPTKFRVENSWGDEFPEKGYLVMTSEWFKEFGFEVAIDKKYLPKEVLEIIKKEPKELPPWDPMGALTS